MQRRDRERRLRRLRFEGLEDRRPLANLAIADVFLIDGQGNRLDAVSEGDIVGVRVNFQTEDLPPGSQYAVQRCLNGDCQSATLNWGAGNSGVGSWIAVWYSWHIPAGAITVQVLLDAADGVTETSENDNSRSVAFNTPDSSDPRFSTPLGGTPNRDWYINNYVDLNAGAADVDYRGRSFTYDGHDAHDIDLAGFEEQDAAVPIYAAEAGVVIDTHDGEGDHCPNADPNLCSGNANYVVLDHGGGWRTIYFHMRKNSVAVAVDGQVGSGQFLGFVGSSGNSSKSHLHWAVYHLGKVVEVYQDPTRLLKNPLPYAGDAPGIVDFATSLAGGTNTSRGLEREIFSPTENPIIWMAIHGIVQATREEVIWYSPDGSEFQRWSNTATGDISGGFRNLQAASSSQTGEWQIAVQVNGTEVARTRFQRTNSLLPEVKVTELGTNFTIIADGTATPVRFDPVEVGGAGSTRSLTVRNVGNDTLTLSGLTVPTGFTVIDGLASSLPAGVSDIVTLRMDTAILGVTGGTLSFTTNDSDEATYNFPIEGIVTSLALSLNNNTIAENAGNAATGTVTRAQVGIDRTMTVYLSSSDTSEAQVAESVVIPVGETSVNFTISAVDDAVLDGSRLVRITASLIGNVVDTAQLTVTDRESLDVQIAPSSVQESAGTNAAVVTIARSNTGNMALPLQVTLTSNRTSEATVPATATIPAGQVSVNVNLNAVDDFVADDTQTVTITATATGYTSGSDTIDVTDDDTPALTVNVVAASVSENAGPAATSVTISRNSSTASSLDITLSSSDTSEATVPINATIPAGQSSLSVNLDAIDDNVADGTQNVTITAFASGFASDSDTLEVTDNEVPALTVTITVPQVLESAGAGATIVTISRNSSATNPLTVNLASSETA